MRLAIAASIAGMMSATVTRTIWSLYEVLGAVVTNCRAAESKHSMKSRASMVGEGAERS
jgi:hypothetical protein